MKRKIKWVIGIAVVLLIALAAWFSFANPFQSSNKRTVTVGTMAGSKADDEIWKEVAKTAKKKYNVTVKMKSFTDYNQPNQALSQHEIDLNSFQHYAFLNNWNKAHHSKIVAIGDTVIAPIKLYSKKYKSLSDLPKGATIAIPNDTSNESRSLYVLKNAGLITLDNKKGFLTVKDVKSSPKDIKIKEIDGSSAPRVLNSVDGAIINNTFATAANLSPKLAIYTEPLNKDSKLWVNFIAANKDDAKNPLYKDVVKAYQTKKTAHLIEKLEKNQSIPAWNRKF